MATIAEKYPATIKKLSETHPAIATAAWHFEKCSEMDEALGFSGAVSKWMNGSNTPGSRSEQTARLWLQANGKLHAHKPVEPRIAAAQNPSVVTLMVVATPDIATKITRIAELMKCEVVEI